ncbi:MAG: hypothetical protein AM1032_000318 [Mycoplasmataceae bacterium]|nr:MAG: hypothetical protein AM1032_000318 [Mycoplasmataceae bacterium]
MSNKKKEYFLNVCILSIWVSSVLQSITFLISYFLKDFSQKFFLNFIHSKFLLKIKIFVSFVILIAPIISYFYGEWIFRKSNKKKF